jgi:hypothetical protein
MLLFLDNATSFVAIKNAIFSSQQACAHGNQSQSNLSLAEAQARGQAQSRPPTVRPEPFAILHERAANPP